MSNYLENEEQMAYQTFRMIAISRLDYPAAVKLTDKIMEDIRCDLTLNNSEKAQLYRIARKELSEARKRAGKSPEQGKPALWQRVKGCMARVVAWRP
jgi:hypothetical protein